jgi:ornithine decarboxylase
MSQSYELPISKIKSLIQPDSELPQQFLDLDDIRLKYYLMKINMPSVKKMYYAVKCFPNIDILREINNVGGDFDVACREEIQLCLKAGVSPLKMMFSNPQKPISHMEFAREVGVPYTVFDGEEELDKHVKYWPEAKLLLRVDGNRTDSIYSMSGKFGTSFKDALSMIDAANDRGLIVHGFHFHIGCEFKDVSGYNDYISKCIELANLVKVKYPHFPMNMLDIGGGYSGTWDKSELLLFKEICNIVENTLSKHNEKGLILCVEPGRYMVQSSFYHAVKIIRTKYVVDEVGVPITYHYINDNGYKFFYFYRIEKKADEPNYVFRNGEILDINAMKRTNGKAVIFGNMFVNDDQCCEIQDVPHLEQDDWLIWRDVGAYQSAYMPKYLKSECQYTTFRSRVETLK